jgi:hypothetical protein
VADLVGAWRYDTSEVIAAPASGYLRSGPAPISQLAIAAETWGGADVHSQLLALTTGATLLAQEIADATMASKFRLTAAPVDHLTWVELAVTPIATTATGPPRKNEDLLVTGFAAAAHAPYVEVLELQRVLAKPNPTQAELDAMTRVLEAAAQDIDWDLGYDADNPAPSPPPPIVVDVNLDRAVELWRLNFSHSGAYVVGPETTPIVSPRDTWYRHHIRLRPLWTKWGIA